MTTGESETERKKEGGREGADRLTRVRPSSIQSSGGEEGATDVGGLNCIAWLAHAERTDNLAASLAYLQLTTDNPLSQPHLAELSRGQAKT